MMHDVLLQFLSGALCNAFVSPGELVIRPVKQAGAVTQTAHATVALAWCCVSGRSTVTGNWGKTLDGPAAREQKTLLSDFVLLYTTAL